ncbi:MAG: cytochrome C [Methylovulum sp.]|nr:cytochrome C [Methylovulum sp.]
MQNFLKSYCPPRSLLITWVLLMSAIVLSITDAQAVPSFTRQTGAACSQCHTQSFGPNLTPFGRDFKLGGYTLTGGSGPGAKLPPISAMVVGSLTHTDKSQDTANLQPGYSKNDNFTFDEASLFYAGRIFDKVGAFSQFTYDGYADGVAWDNADFRFADQAEIADTPVTYGISLNNSPTVQDLWNTTPAWGFPYTGSGVQPGIATAALIDGGLGTSQVGGATAYTMINNLVYLEVGAYDSFSRDVQRGLAGALSDSFIKLAGPAPYWRTALQYDTKGHFFAIGHYGMSADVSLPNSFGDASNGADHYTDVAFDATYQYMANPKHIFEVKTTYIYEDQNLSVSRSGGSRNTGLHTFKFNTAYTFDQTYGVTFAYNKLTGSSNSNVYPDFASYQPNSEYYTAELVYVPFGKANSLMNPWLNIRTSLQYIGYSQFDGTSQFVNGNNTFMVNGWLAF